LKLSGLQDGGVKKYPSPKPATGVHLYYLKNSDQNLKKNRIIIHCKTPQNIA